MKKAILIVILVFILHIYIAANEKGDGITESVEETTGTMAGVSLDIGPELDGCFTLSLGVAQKLKYSDKSVIFLGSYTEHHQFGYLVWERKIYGSRSPFFYGYRLGFGYVKWGDYKWTFTIEGAKHSSHGINPYISFIVGFRIRLWDKTHLQVSSEVLGIRIPANLITISIQ
ncbi:MAG: hypothetical protein RAP70_02300 [Candidatus Celaenobacter antarcticus]|nr:hypothetical protein [Candidatus Celaenobacter antarcticus]MDP8313885.1 hypothetical protein [Candidatus Celaenobacter antarcticus]